MTDASQHTQLGAWDAVAQCMGVVQTEEEVAIAVHDARGTADVAQVDATRRGPKLFSSPCHNSHASVAPSHLSPVASPEVAFPRAPPVALSATFAPSSDAVQAHSPEVPGRTYDWGCSDR